MDDLLPQLVTAHPQYARSLESAWAAARHWELVEPQDAPDPAAVMAPVPVVNQIRRMVETSLEVSSLSCRSRTSTALDVNSWHLCGIARSVDFPPLAEERVQRTSPAMRQN